MFLGRRGLLEGCQGLVHRVLGQIFPEVVEVELNADLLACVSDQLEGNNVQVEDVDFFGDYVEQLLQTRHLNLRLVFIQKIRGKLGQG